MGRRGKSGLWSISNFAPLSLPRPAPRPCANAGDAKTSKVAQTTTAKHDRITVFIPTSSKSNESRFGNSGTMPEESSRTEIQNSRTEEKVLPHRALNVQRRHLSVNLYSRIVSRKAIIPDASLTYLAVFALRTASRSRKLPPKYGYLSQPSKLGSTRGSCVSRIHCRTRSRSLFSVGA